MRDLDCGRDIRDVGLGEWRSSFVFTIIYALDNVGDAVKVVMVLPCDHFWSLTESLDFFFGFLDHSKQIRTS